MLARVFEGEFGDTRRALFGDHLDAFDYARDDLVLEADVFAFGIFADDDQVDAGPLRFQAGKILDRPEIGEKVKFLAQRDVDAFKTAANGRGHRPFKATLLRSMDS